MGPLSMYMGPHLVRNVYVELCKSLWYVTSAHRFFQAKTRMSTQNNFQGQLKLCSTVLQSIDAGMPGYFYYL